MSKLKWFWLGLFVGYLTCLYSPGLNVYMGPLIWLLFAALTIGFFGREFVDWIAKKPWSVRKTEERR